MLLTDIAKLCIVCNFEVIPTSSFPIGLMYDETKISQKQQTEKMPFSYICTARARIFTDKRFLPGFRYYRGLLNFKMWSKSLAVFEKITKNLKTIFFPLLTPQIFFSKNLAL